MKSKTHPSPAKATCVSHQGLFPKLYATLLAFALVPLAATAAPPDLTNGGVPNHTSYINLGPTGLTGWVYREPNPKALLGDHNYSGQSRQILVTTVAAGSPAVPAGVQANDVILGASGDGSAPVDFTSDARKSLALAIAAAEARTTPELKLKVWRAGVTSTHTLTLQNLGAYGPNAPMADAKCAQIAENARQALLAANNAGSYGMGALALMALDDPAHPDRAAMKAQIDAHIQALLPVGGLPNVDKAGWQRGHTLIVLAEYYLTYGEHPGGGVFQAIEAYVDSITQGQSIFGTFGHIFAGFKWPDDAVTPMMAGYGAINSAAVPGLYALLLAKECNVSHPKLDECIDRGLTFYGSYAGRGCIPYGEHEPAANEFTSNGKSGSAALLFGLAQGKEEESKYFAKMSAAGFSEYESGHTGCFFNNLWSPLGAAQGGDDAIKAYFAQTSWLYDLARKWDGSFAYNVIYGSNSYSGFNSSVPYVLTYALPQKRLHMTGRGRTATGVLDATERTQALNSGLYDETTRTKAQLIADLGDWSAVVHTRAANALAGMTLDQADLDTLHALASDPQGTSREGALLVLEKTANAASAPVLSAILTDADPHIRRLAARALHLNPGKAAHLNAVMTATAAAKRATFPMDTRDPLHHDLYRMGNLLFSTSGILYSGTSVNLTGVDRQLLYPAVRAIASCPAGIGRSTLSNLFTALTEADSKALGDTLLNTAYYRSPADPMFADGAREKAMDAMVRYKFAEAIPVAERSIRADFFNNPNRTLYGDMFKDLQQFKGTNLLVTPDPGIIRLCEDFIAQYGVDFYSALNAQEAALVLDAIRADSQPASPIYLKSFDWVVSDAAVLNLPANQTQLHAAVTDHAKGELSYSWRKVYGSGNVTFGSANSKDTTVTFDGSPGPYLFEVSVVDARGFSEIKETVSVTLYDAGGNLPANSPPIATPQNVTAAPFTATAITLTGSDPENAPLVYTVTSPPTHGTLSGTAPNLTYISDNSYHNGADGFTFMVTDSFGQTASATVTITVDTSLLVTHVHESFDYPVGMLLAGNAGGTGMTGTWLDGPNAGKAWIYDASTVTTPVNTGHGTYSWDGVVDNLPTHAEAGTRMVGLGAGTGGDSYEIHRPLAQNAGVMAGADGVLWASVAYHRQSGSFAQHIGLALSTDCFTNSGRALSTSGGHGSNLGRGIGVARPLDVGSSYCAAIFNGGSTIASTTAPTFVSGDFVMVVKFEFGATDKVTAYAFREDEIISEELFDARSISATAAIDENTLNRITVACGRGDPSFDEIRVGDSFAAVIGLSESAVDVTPPTPNPMTFAVAPTANATAISMTATTAADPSGVEYYFTCTSGGGKDSGWQSSPTYIDSNLQTDTQYTYTVTARDKSVNWNIGAPSAPASATTPADVATVYEPFNYPVGELLGLNGGNGFGGPWADSAGTNNQGYVRDETTNVFFDNTTLNWNGLLDNGFPTAPTPGARYMSSDGQGTSNVDVKRQLASSAGAMAGSDGVLWMSAVYRYPNSTSGSGIHFGLTDGGHLTDRGRRTSSATMDFIGVSGWNGSTAWSQQLNPTIIDSTTATNYIWNQFARTAGGVNMSSTVDKIIVLKFTFGASDKVEAFWFNETTSMASITETAFDAGKVGATYAAGIDENNLNTITYSQGRFDNAVDEFRIGNSFEEVIGLTGGGGEGDTTPPMLSSGDIVDDQGGAPVVPGTVVAYDITFSEDINASTVTPSDFGNAGTASGTIGTVVAISPSIYRVRFNALSTGTLQLRVNAGAVINDLAGNQLDTTSAILDDTTISVMSANSAPVWASNPVNEASANEDAPYSGTLANDASDANGNNLEYAKVSGPAWLVVAADGSLSGVPANADVGLNVFTVSVSDNIAPAVEATLNIAVSNTNDAPVFSADPIAGADATEDSAYIGTIAGAAIDIDAGSSLAYAKVSGPAWLGVAANGTLSGTPTNGDVGSNSFTVSVDDGNGGTDTATLNIAVINTNDAPVFIADPISGNEATEGEAYVGTLAGSTSDDDGDAPVFAKTAGPAWLSVAANGALSGTPTHAEVGPNAFTVSVSDGNGGSDTATLDISVSAAILIPGKIAWNVFDISGNVSDVSTDGTLVQAHGGADLGTADIVDGATFDINGVTFDDGFVFDSPSHKDTIGNRGGSYTAPNAAYSTLCKFADRQGSGTATFTFNNLTVGNTYQIQLWHADNVTVAMENGMVLNDGGIVDTPLPGTTGHATLLREISEGGYGQYAIGTFVAAASTQQFLARAYGGLTTTPVGQANVTINGCQLRLIASVPDTTPPTLASSGIIDDQGGANVTENDLVTYTVTFSEDMNGITVDAADFSNAGSAPVTIGSVSETSPGVFSVQVTPAAPGTLNLQVSPGAVISDVAGNALDTMAAIADDTTITVDDANVAPNWTANPVSEADATEDSAYASTLADDAGDGNAGDSLVFAKVSGPAWLNVAPDGTLSGTPGNADVGANAFTVSVTDSNSPAVEATLNITVDAVNDAPVASNGSATTDEDTAVGITLLASDIDSFIQSYTVMAGPTKGTLSGTAPNLTYTPNANTNGADSFTFRASDGSLDSNTATISITVNAVNDAPVASNGSATTDEDTAVGVTLAATDIDSSIQSYTVVTAPTKGTLSGTAPNLTYTPNANTNGADSFTFRASDGSLDSNTATISLTVTAVNDAPAFSPASFTAADATEGAAYTGQTLGDRATDADAGDTITYSKVSGPAWLAVAQDGTLSGTPGGGTAGSNVFVVRATDSALATADATLTINVLGLPLPWISSDIGTGMLAGSATHAAGTFTQAGSGSVGGTSDRLHYTYQTLTGDGEIIARITNLQNTGTSSRVGVMIRDTLAPNSKQIFMGMTGSNAYRWVRRTGTGSNSSTTSSSTGTVPNTWVRLVRSGTTITAYTSTNGTSWTTVGSTTNTTFASTCYIGLAVASGRTNTLNTSQFSNLSVTP